MKVIKIETGVGGYRDFVHFVRTHGKRRDPRGIPTVDAGPVTVMIKDISYTLPLHVGRNTSRKIAAAEAVQLIGGYSSPALLDWVSPNFKRFAESNGEYHGAYGRRISSQLDHVVTKLKNDVDTRQAVITLWDPWLDNQPNKKDYPCTVMLHFAIIDAVLEMTVTMRSQDVWLGAPFDWFQFTQLQWTVARLLHVQPGEYRHITLSTHLYESNIKDVEKLTFTPPMSEWEWQPQGVGREGDTVARVKNRARNLLSPIEFEWTESERWYREQFAGFFA